jgi:hypothetical protein
MPGSDSLHSMQNLQTRKSRCRVPLLHPRGALCSTQIEWVQPCIPCGAAETGSHRQHSHVSYVPEDLPRRHNCGAPRHRSRQPGHDSSTRGYARDYETPSQRRLWRCDDDGTAESITRIRQRQCDLESASLRPARLRCNSEMPRRAACRRATALKLIVALIALACVPRICAQSNSTTTPASTVFSTTTTASTSTPSPTTATSQPSASTTTQIPSSTENQATTASTSTPSPTTTTSQPSASTTTQIPSSTENQATTASTSTPSPTTTTSQASASTTTKIPETTPIAYPVMQFSCQPDEYRTNYSQFSNSTRQHVISSSSHFDPDVMMGYAVLYKQNASTLNTSALRAKGACVQNVFSTVCDIICDELVNCSGHGRCSGAGNCTCDIGWNGTNCSVSANASYVEAWTRLLSLSQIQTQTLPRLGSRSAMLVRAPPSERQHACISIADAS